MIQALYLLIDASNTHGLCHPLGKTGKLLQRSLLATLVFRSQPIATIIIT